MTKVIAAMSMSLEGFLAGPGDGKSDPPGRHGGMRIFDGCFSGRESVGDPRFRPAPGANRDEVERMFADSGAFIFGRRTYDIANGWGGRHPVNDAPVFVVTHNPLQDFPLGPSSLTFVTEGIAGAIAQAKAACGGKDVKLGGGSPAKRALAIGRCDEIVIHVAPYPRDSGVTYSGSSLKGSLFRSFR
jgi:dihydrofolate reductase